MTAIRLPDDICLTTLNHAWPDPRHTSPRTWLDLQEEAELRESRRGLRGALVLDQVAFVNLLTLSPWIY